MCVVAKSTVPYKTGVIVSIIGSGVAGDASYIYCSSSVMSTQLAGGISHGSTNSQFFINVGNDNIIYLSQSLYGGTPSWGINLIGYY
jgi:hypothetical protein